MRIPFVVLVLAVVLVPIHGTATAGETAALVSQSRDRITVSGGMVRLGDLFTNTGPKAELVVDRAPKPGEEAVYDVHRLAAIARSHGLLWQARSWQERVVVARPGQTVGRARILAAVREALAEKGFDGNYELNVIGRTLGLTLPVDAPATVSVESLRLNKVSGQFVAVVTAPAGHPNGERLSVAGRVHRLVEVPTLARRISGGEIIRQEDIAWTTMRAARVGRTVVTDAAQLIGMTPRRTIPAEKLIRAGDVRAPRTVTKGSVVTMVLRTPHMVITSKGRAMEHGAKGETIRVMNTQSKAIIEGEVTAANTVRVTASAFLPVARSRR